MLSPEPQPAKQTINPPSPEPEAPTSTFGERIENTLPELPPAIPLDQYGLPLYREHDEFAEWLSRHNDQDPI